MTESLTTTLIDRIISSWPWYLIRGSGFAAAVILVLLIMGGIGQITGHTFKLLEPLKAWAGHRRLGIAFAITTLIHVAGLFFDTFQKFTVSSIFIPFTSAYKPFFVGLGTLALYLTIIVTLTSLRWHNTKPRVWKAVHYASYAILGLVFVHGLFAGTDTTGGAIRIAWIAAGILITAIIIPRLRMAGSLRGPNI